MQTPPDDLPWFDTRDLTADQCWQLFDWCLAHGADEFTFDTVELTPVHVAQIERTGGLPSPIRTQSDDLLRRLEAYQRFSEKRWGLTSDIDGDFRIVRRLWTLCPEAVAVLKNVQPEGLFVFPIWKDFWLEDPFIYRQGAFMAGVISHEGFGQAWLSDSERAALSRTGITWGTKPFADWFNHRGD